MVLSLLIEVAGDNLEDESLHTLRDPIFFSEHKPPGIRSEATVVLGAMSTGTIDASLEHKRTFRLMSDIFLYSTWDLPIIRTCRAIVARVNRDGLQEVLTLSTRKSIQQIFRVSGSTNANWGTFWILRMAIPNEAKQIHPIDDDVGTSRDNFNLSFIYSLA